MMTMHKLTAGDGYTYLTRHVAGGDVDRSRGQDAADYYTAKGNPPGRWLGRGAHLLDLDGRQVTEAQMKQLFGVGMHPDAENMISDYLAAHLKPDMTPHQQAAVTKRARKHATLGTEFPVYKPLRDFQTRVDERLATITAETGRPPSATEVAKVKREESQAGRSAVAGYDLVFTPTKSATVLWGLHPDQRVRGAVREAHDEAVASAMNLLEQHAAYTRTGKGGVAQIETKGLIAAAFDHFDNRSGDPNIHTHVAIANKVQGVDGKWRSLDARGLYRMTVAASEHYSTAFQAALTDKLDVSFTPRRKTRGDRSAISEINAVPAKFRALFSKRRVAIEDRYAELVAAYRLQHGAEPSQGMRHKLTRQANLDTRDAKKAPRSLDEMRRDWVRQLVENFGAGAVEQLAAISPRAPSAVVEAADAPSHAAVDVPALASAVVEAVSQQRSSWTRWNLHAEAARQLRSRHQPGHLAVFDQLVEQVVDAAVSPAHSIRIEAPELVDEPTDLRRSDRVSVFVEHAAGRFTSRALLDAEDRLVTRALTPTEHGIDPAFATAVLDGFEATTGKQLDAGQRRMAMAFACDPRAIVVGLGPAGSGKTTTMRAYNAILQAAGRRLIPLGTKATAAAVLQSELGVPCENIDKFLWEHAKGTHAHQLDAGDPVPVFKQLYALSPGDVVLVDEAGMAGTFKLDRVAAIAKRHGALVRPLGDHKQLSAIESGGALAHIAAEAGAVELDVLHRFTEPAEAEATLKLRDGDASGLDYHQANNRINGGLRADMVDAAYTGWRTDMLAGRISILMATANSDVTSLAARARRDRIEAGHVTPGGPELHDGNHASVGDWIITRDNDRRNATNGGRDFVRNGDTWTVEAVLPDGAIRVKHHGHGGALTLSADYVAAQVELAYATTTMRAQGATVDTVHALVSIDMARENLYVAASRGRHGTWLYAVTHEHADHDNAIDKARHDPKSRRAREVLEQVVARSGAEISATQTIRDTQDHAESLATLAPRFSHAVDQTARLHYRHIITDLLPHDVAALLTNDDAYPTLVAALLAAEATGWQPEQALALAARPGQLETTDSPARPTAARIRHAIDDLPAPTPLAPPTRADAERYARLLRDSRYCGLRLNPDDALTTPRALSPHHPGVRPPGLAVPLEKLRAYANTTATTLGIPVREVEAHAAWPHLAATFHHLQDQGRDLTDLSQLSNNGTGVADFARTLRRAHPETTTNRVPDLLRHHYALNRVLDPGTNRLVRSNTGAFVAVIAAMRRAETAGHDPVAITRLAAANVDLDDTSCPAARLAWAINRQAGINALRCDEATADTWPTLAWALKAHQNAGGDPSDLTRKIRTAGDLDELLANVQTATRQRSATPGPDLLPPWISIPQHLLDSPHLDENWRSYLRDSHTLIAARTATLAERLTTEQPSWAAALGPVPDNPIDRTRWLQHAAIVTAYRDHFGVTSNDPTEPLGPYPESGRHGNRAYWHAADAFNKLHHLNDNPSHEPDPATTQLAADIYLALPDRDRTSIATSMAQRLGTDWHGHPSDPDTAAVQPNYAHQLISELEDCGLVESTDRLPSTPAANQQPSRRTPTTPVTTSGSSDRRAAPRPTPVGTRPLPQPPPAPEPEPPQPGPQL